MTTLAVLIDTDNRPGCGVFTGEYEGFAPGERNKRVPFELDESGFQTFLFDRPVREPGIPLKFGQPNIIRRWHYAAIGWNKPGHIQYPYVRPLTLENHCDSSEEHWAVVIDSGLRIILPGYEPGARQRHFR